MGQHAPFTDAESLEAQIKYLGDDELLDFWEETQHLNDFLEGEQVSRPAHDPEYERVILQELQLRTSRR